MKSKNGEVKIAMKQCRNVQDIPFHVACSDITYTYFFVQLEHPPLFAIRYYCEWK